MPEPVPADFAADLAALEQRQALLHKALAAFQAGIPEPQPLGFYGLALYHRMAWKDCARSAATDATVLGVLARSQAGIEAVLVHAAGGEIASGFLPLGEPHEILGLQKITAELLLQRPWPYALFLSKPQQSESPIPWPNPCPVSEALPDEPPAAAAGPEPEPPAAAVEPEPKPEALPDEPLTAEEVAAIKDDLDRIFNCRPNSVKEVTAQFRATYEVGARTPVAKAITTREHVAWLREQIDPILADIAEFEQNVKAGVAESMAQGAA